MTGTRRHVLVAAGIYCAAALVLFGRGVLMHPRTEVVGDDGPDKTLYMWALEWWPRAIMRGHNPLDVDVAWMPHGFDFGLGTAGGGLALAAAPLTALEGPVPTYNVLILAAPALAATSAFLLAHGITGRFTASLVGGWMFGFSSYELGHLLGHLPLAFVGLVPLVPYLVLRRAAGTLSARTFVGLLALALALQFLIVTQIAVTIVLVGVIAAAAAGALWGTAVRRTIVESAAGVALAAILVSPLAIYAAVSHAAAPARSPFAESADVLNFAVPTQRTWIRSPGSSAVAERFTGTGAELGAYLGLPLLILVGLAAAGALRRARARGPTLLVILLAATALLSLGTRIKVAGVIVGVGPWSALSWLPLVGSALPVRLTLYTSLFAGLLVALALADQPSRRRWALAACGIVATLPNLQLPTWQSTVPRPAFFASGRSADILRRDATVLVLPYGPGGWSLLWQAEADFRFRIVGGHFALRVTPQEEEWRDVYTHLGSGRLTPSRLREFLTAHRVDHIVVAPGAAPRARRLVDVVVGTPPTRVLDTLVYSSGRARLHPFARPDVPTSSARPPRSGMSVARSVAHRASGRIVEPNT